MLNFLGLRHRFFLIAVFVICSIWFGANTFFPGPVAVLAGELAPLYPGYPEVFDQEGVLQIIHQEQLVVSDATLHLLPAATFHVPKKGSVGQFAMPVGSRVGVILTKDKEVESVWFLAAGESASSQNSEKDKTNSGGPLKLENGIWTN